MNAARALAKARGGDTSRREPRCGPATGLRLGLAGPRRLGSVPGMTRTPSRVLGALALLTFVSSLPAAAPDAVEAATLRRVRAHTAFLADDLLEGRGTATRGHELAALYVTAQFARLGLQPAGDAGTYRQAVRFLESRSDLAAGALTLHTAAGETVFTPMAEAIVRPTVSATEVEVRAPAVFVGFGIHAPDFGYDDFGSIDLRGKVAVILAGSPDQLPATARAHFNREKTAELARRGAVAVVSVLTPREQNRSPWAAILAGARFPRMRLMAPAGGLIDDYPELRATAVVSLAAAEKLLAGGPRPAADVFAAGERGEPQAFALGFEIGLSARAETLPVESGNVLGLIPGTDPSLAGEPIVITSHLDHLGLGLPVNGDGIFNGAYDNAIGIGIVLAMAERLADGPPLRRPVLFAALTAEEKGLLGADFLAAHPPAGVTRFAANLNIDMSLFPAPVRDVIARGEEHSTLGAVIRAAAAARGFTVSPDPTPEEVIFVRSDQYSFVRAGVPALYLTAGTRSDDPAVDLGALQADFRRNRYHKPGDDLTQAIDWPSAAAFALLSETVVRSVADNPEAPRWLPGDFFGGMFGRPDNR